MKHIAGPALCLALLGAAASTALAGPNAGGTLILHSNPALVYCSDTPSYCGQSGLTSCDAAINHKDGADTALLFALAAFSSSASPRLSGITFGITYPDGLSLVAYGACGDFELATAGWPSSGEGTAVTWNSARTTQLVDVYWFAGYNYYSPTPSVLALTPHPTQGAMFADDSIPSILDPIAALGSFGFDTPGSTPCPGAAVPGACCFADGSCTVLNETECGDAQGTFQGPGTNCDPNPCAQPLGACCHLDGTCEVLSAGACNEHGDEWFGGATCDPLPCAPLGACCFDGGICEILPEDHCVEDGGVYQGDNSACDPDPCTPVPTQTKSWGEIKHNYR